MRENMSQLAALRLLRGELAAMKATQEIRRDDLLDLLGHVEAVVETFSYGVENEKARCLCTGTLGRVEFARRLTLGGYPAVAVYTVNIGLCHLLLKAGEFTGTS